MKDWPQALEFKFKAFSLFFSKEEYDTEGKNELDSCLDILSHFVSKFKTMKLSSTILMIVMVIYLFFFSLFIKYI